MKRKMRKSAKRESVFCYIMVGLLAFMCVYPLWIAFCTSLAEEAYIVKNGYPLWIPENASLDSYKYLIGEQGKIVFRSIGVTLTTVALGTLFAMFIMITFSYAAAQKREEYAFAHAISFIAWFTTVFGGGVLPWYILTTQYYGLQNNVWALFIPSGMSVFNMFILRNGFKAVPIELVEAARIDGAAQSKIFFSICLPLNKVSIVTVALFTVLRYWNDFHLSLYLISDSKLFPMQKILYTMTKNLTALMSGDLSISAHATPPVDSVRMAMAMIIVLPIVIFYPFAQKYFVKGITVGGVKG